MSEEEKIEEVIKEYKAYFDYSDADVGCTRKGVWLFYRYDVEHDGFISFNRFSTAEELRGIIVTELLDDVNCAIEATAESLGSKDYMEEINNMLDSYDFEGKAIELLYNLAVINNRISEYGGVFKALHGLVSSRVRPD